MRTSLLIVASTLFSAIAFSQPRGKDSLSQWKGQRAQLSRMIDSLTIVVTPQQNAMTYIEQSLRNTGAELNAEVRAGMPGHTADPAKLDSLKQRMALLSVINITFHNQFDGILIQLDSCLGIRNEVEQKILAAGSKLH